jgi:hypothetical protein
MIIETAASGRKCETCDRDTEPVEHLRIRTDGRVIADWWQCLDREACKLYKAGVRLQPSS